MGFLKRDDGDSQAAAEPATPCRKPEDAPHAATYEAGSLAGIPAVRAASESSG